MDDVTRQTGVRAAQLSLYGSGGGILAAVALGRYRKVPQLVCLGIGIGSGMAFVEGNAKLKDQLEKQSAK